MKSKLTCAAAFATLISSGTVAVAEESAVTPAPPADPSQPLRADREQQEPNAEKCDASRGPTSAGSGGATSKFGEAVGTATTTAATDLAETAGELTRAAERPGLYNPVAVEVNPLGLLVGGRISLNVEYAPATHHVLIVSPHFARTSATVGVGPNETMEKTFTGVGGEIGYRYYTGHNGMNGIFVGPSLVGGVYNASFPSQSTSFTNVGVAVDVGYQQVLKDHVVLGAGVGLEYLRVSEEFYDLPAGPSTIATSGLKPRLLAQIGYAF